MIKYLLLIMMIFPILILSQEKEEENIWQPLQFLDGSWIGDGTGKQGIARGERNYSFILNKQFIKMENMIRFEPQEEKPQGETIRDMAIFSKDQLKNSYVIRKFTSDGSVLTFVLDSLTSDNRNFVFNLVSAENLKNALNARLTYKIVSKDEFTEILELENTNDTFEIWSRNFWRRAREQ